MVASRGGRTVAGAGDVGAGARYQHAGWKRGAGAGRRRRGGGERRPLPHARRTAAGRPAGSRRRRRGGAVADRSVRGLPGPRVVHGPAGGTGDDSGARARPASKRAPRSRPWRPWRTRPARASSSWPGWTDTGATSSRRCTSARPARCLAGPCAGDPTEILESWAADLGARRLDVVGDGVRATRALLARRLGRAAVLVDDPPPLAPVIARIAFQRRDLAIAPHAVQTTLRSPPRRRPGPRARILKRP